MFSAQIRDGAFLRLLEERHTEEVFALVDRDREYLREWLPWVDATQSSDDTLSFIHSSLDQYASNKSFAAGIWNEGHFCGVIGSHPIDWVNRKVEIGYWVGYDSQGLGLVSGACRIVIDHLFGELDLHRVVISCATANEKSCAIAQRLNFSDEGIAREALLLHGRYHDLRRFAMLKQDWPLR